MRSGRAVVGVSSDLLNLSPPHSYSQSQSDLSLNHISSQSVHHPQITSTLKSNVTDDDEDSGQEWSHDRTTGSSNRYSEFLDDFQHSKSCERSKHYRHAQRKRRFEEQVSDTNIQNTYTVNDRKSLLCFKNRTNTRQRSSLDGPSRSGCCHCNKGQNIQDNEGGENVTLKELSNESDYFDYYYIQQPIEDDLDKRFSRRASDFELQKEGHSQSLPFLLSRSQTKEKRSRHRKRPSFRSVTEGQRLTRSLEELPGDIKEHILQCKCSCDHLGYGNYSTLSLRDISGPSWKASSMESKSGAPQIEDKKEPLIKYKQKDLEIRYHILGVICLVLVLAGVAGVGVSVPLALKTTPTPSAAPVEDRLGAAKTLLSETPLVDGHNDLPWNIRKFMHNRLHSFNMSADLSALRPWSRSSWSHTDIPRLRRGHVGAQFWVSYVPCESQYMNAVQLTIEQIDLIKRLVDQYPNDLRLATSSDDIESSFREGRIASLIGVEGGHAIQNSLGVLRSLYDLGVRYMTLTHTCSTPWAECARNSESDLEDPNSPRGLTHFGKTVVREMNRLGIVVDLSHVSQATMREALQVSRSPVLFSHSSVYAICKNPRNVPDDILRKVKSNGGLVMVSFYNHFLTCSEHATVKNVIDHINHVRKIAGVDHVGIGADFDGVNKLPTGLEDVSKYPNLFAELMNDPTWNEEDLKKLAGLNLIRVLREVEQGAKELKMQRVGPYEEDVPYSQIKVKNDCTYRFLKDDRS